VADAVEPTLDAAKQVAQLWESNGPMPNARAGRVRVYFRGYVEYNVNDTVKLMDAVGFGEAAGVPEDKKVGSLIQHTINRFQMKNQFAIDGAEAESLQVSASLQPSAEGPMPI
jgi:predicted transcriptional regulator